MSLAASSNVGVISISNWLPMPKHVDNFGGGRVAASCGTHPQRVEVTRSKHEQTLYDQLVNRVLKHQAEFPLSIIQVNTTARLAK